MMIWHALPLLLAFVSILTPGCVLSRSGVTALSKEQVTYYTKLDEMLRANREGLKIGLEQQLKTDWQRERNLLQWERDLAKAEVILQTDQGIKGAQKLLHMKLAEMDLVDANRLATMEEINAARKQVILRQYDNIIKAVRAIKTNAIVLSEYIGSNDETFALRSLDVDAFTRAIDATREVQEELGSIEKRWDEERKRDRERVRKSIERTRSLMLEIFAK